MHPANETIKSKVIHVYAPAVVGALISLCSLLVDILGESSPHWFQRSGAIIAMVGGYIAFHESKQFFKTLESEDGNTGIYFNAEIWYKWLALVYAALGTLIWGYGDLIFKS